MDRALVRDRADIVEFLLDLGWNPDRPVVTEETRKCNPLGYAIRYGQAKIAELLLEHGANAEAASWDGIPARELCREYLTGNAQEEFLVLLDKRTDDLH
jgi:ankyrin repeat protein